MASSHIIEKSMVNDKTNHGVNNHKSQPQVTISSPASPSPPSSSSSPSHEFSFTISLHSSSAATSSSNSTSSQKSPKANRVNNATSSSFAIDLSPADEIFFHGHLLPLHFLSNLPSAAAVAAVASPRSSTNSLDSFTLPIADFDARNDAQAPKTTATEAPKANKPRPFSLFNKWKKVTTNNNNNKEAEEEEEEEEKQEKRNGTNKLRFDVAQVLKRYMRMVRPLVFFRGGGRRRARGGVDLRRQPYSFSGVLSPRNDNSQNDLTRLGRKRPGEYSAPASMRTSPSNSGLLVATATLPSAVSDSTMEELQAAIQAAIAHCKNSSAGTDGNNKKS